jgi:hypothetical protein
MSVQEKVTFDKAECVAVIDAPMYVGKVLSMTFFALPRQCFTKALAQKSTDT